MQTNRIDTRAVPVFNLALVLSLFAASTGQAKTPGSQYCFLGVCHRVMTLAETKAQIGKPRPMHASHYDSPERDRFNPSLLTSSGEVFRPDAPDNAASPIYPDGTQVAVFSPVTKRGAIVRINNAGPYYGNRMIDLSRGLAERLGFAHNGVAKVVVEVLAEPSPAEARYVRSRRYAPVAGYIGKVAAIEDIRANWAQRQLPRVVVAQSEERKQQSPTRPAIFASKVVATLDQRLLAAPANNPIAPSASDAVIIGMTETAFRLPSVPKSLLRIHPVVGAKASNATVTFSPIFKLAAAEPWPARRALGIPAPKGGWLSSVAR